MGIIMKTYTYTEKKDTRSGFGAGLAELGRTNPNVVALCADLIGSLKMDQFIKENPERFFQIGIAEANMMCIAAGLTIGGKIPFTGTFANFSTGRVYDQIRQSIAYSGKNVKICASHAGLTLGEDGATHQILEDIGLMKMLPGMVVINPCDYNQTKAATLAIAEYVAEQFAEFLSRIGAGAGGGGRLCRGLRAIGACLPCRRRRRGNQRDRAAQCGGCEAGGRGIAKGEGSESGGVRGRAGRGNLTKG